jgi:hypothetical protein
MEHLQTYPKYRYYQQQRHSDKCFKKRNHSIGKPGRYNQTVYALRRRHGRQ